MVGSTRLKFLVFSRRVGNILLLSRMKYEGKGFNGALLENALMALGWLVAGNYHKQLDCNLAWRFFLSLC